MSKSKNAYHDTDTARAMLTANLLGYFAHKALPATPFNTPAVETARLQSAAARTKPLDPAVYDVR